jgi:hypothetical protein
MKIRLFFSFLLLNQGIFYSPGAFNRSFSFAYRKKHRHSRRAHSYKGDPQQGSG